MFCEGIENGVLRLYNDIMNVERLIGFRLVFIWYVLGCRGFYKLSIFIIYGV